MFEKTKGSSAGEDIWSLEQGSGPIVATAIHDGHEMRRELMQYVTLDKCSRLREEDPFTGQWTGIAPIRVVGLRSRFEVDLNRPRDSAIYRNPEDAWGLNVWIDALPEDMAERSLKNYDAFYGRLESLYRQLAVRHGQFLVLDLHSYNHRRTGANGVPADPLENPQINIGTGTMLDRGRWDRLVDRFMDDLTSYDFPGGRLDVRENVRFRGGACAAWAHRTFPDSACVLSIEVKKFFMDEWTGEPDQVLLNAVGKALGATLAGLLEELNRA